MIGLYDDLRSYNLSNSSFDFVESFVQSTKEFESPTSFWKWSAYSAVAATLRFNCYLNWGTSKLYPNLYILLLADSAAYRKDAAPELVAELLKESSHTKVIQGRSSWQGICDELSNDVGKKSGVPIKYGGGIIIATEFTASFVEDNSLIQMMTEGYSFASEFEYLLRSGKVKIKNRCINLLGGSNETLLRDLYSVKATYGGLLRRTCLIKPDKRRPPNPLVDTNSHLDLANKKALVDILNEIKKLTGEFNLTPEAKQCYKEFYVDLYNSYEKIEDRSGFIQGVHGIIMKLCMVLAASIGTTVITDTIIQRSVKEVLALKENYTTFIMGAGKNPQANMGGTILASLWTKVSTNGTNLVKRRDILFQYWNEISGEELDKLLLTLEGAGVIRMVPQGQEPAYELTKKAIDAFEKNVKTKATGSP